MERQNEHKMGNEAMRTVAEFAAMIGTSRAWVYKAMADGKILSVRFGRSIRISQREIDRIMAEGVR